MSADPFQPLGVRWTGVSPKLAALRRLVALVSVAVLASGVALGLWFWLGGWGVVAALVAAVALGVWLWSVIGRGVESWGYTERDEDLLVKRGLFYRQLVVVPYGRMQFVDVQSGPLERAYGLASVQLHTASAATDAHIPGLPPEEAARLRDRLASLGESQSAGL
jgi:membrane protein YdbS with pleckstrin-like domain